MKFIAKIIFAVAINAFGIWAAANYIPGFGLSADFIQLLKIALVFTVLNFVLKPILKLILGPIIILTLGLGLILVNALVLFILDKFSEGLTIETIPALIYATILISVINFVVHFATKQS
jgi:putative membrane protein